MDPRLLRYYNQELQYLRELGGEFAEEFPKVAARLGMSGIEVADPYVERLLGGGGVLGGGVGVLRGARAAEARCRAAALHAVADRDRLPALSCADALDAGRAAETGTERLDSGERGHGAARHLPPGAARQGRPDRVRIPHRPGRHALAAGARRRELLLVCARPG